MNTLDVSALTALVHLYCYDNNLTALDVSKNTALTILHCRNNEMKQLYLPKEESSFSITSYTTGNPDIEVFVVTVDKKDGTAPTSSVTATFAVESFNRIEKKQQWQNHHRRNVLRD